MTQVGAGRSLQPVTDELHAVEEERESSEKREQRHGEKPGLPAVTSMSAR